MYNDYSWPMVCLLINFIQITFGSDFTQQFNEIERDHNILKEDFVVVVFKGLGLCLRFPGYRVIIQLHVSHVSYVWLDIALFVLMNPYNVIILLLSLLLSQISILLY